MVTQHIILEINKFNNRYDTELIDIDKIFADKTFIYSKAKSKKLLFLVLVKYQEKLG